MKKILFALTLLLTASQVTNAQRIGFVDMEFILEKIPEYTEAQKKIDAIAESWKEEIDKKYADIDEKYKKFQSEQYLYSEDMKKKKIEEIEKLEKEVKEYQKSKFGFEGELYKKRQELIKPIQDQVYNAIQEYASENSYDFIFEKGSSTTILYASERRDKTEEILKKLGY